MIYLEGPRNTGKSFLMSQLGQEEYRLFKFPFPQVYKHLSMDEKIGKGFAFGKDIQLLELRKWNLVKEPIVVDRGFLSTAVYGVLDNRMTIQEGHDYLKYIKLNYDMNKIKILCFAGENPKSEDDRNKKDGWEGLTYDKQVEMYREFIDDIGERIYVFSNWFNEQSVGQFKDLMRELSYEYK